MFQKKQKTLNALRLHNDRDKTIKLFEGRNVMSSNYALDAKSEPKEYDGAEKSKHKFVKSIAEKTESRRHESDKADNEQLDTTDMPDLENEVSAEHEGDGLKQITPEQMVSRLAISLAQLKAGNNSQKLKNEIRQLLYSLYRSKKINKTIYKHLMNTII